MKLISTFLTYTATASSNAAGFPASNVANLDPGKRWKAGAFSSDEWLKLSFGAAQSAGSLFLNNVNFSRCVIYYGESGAWQTLVVGGSAVIYPVQDRAGKRKLWVDLPAGFKDIMLSIPTVAVLDNGETVPAIGNAVFGVPTALPPASEWSPEVVTQATAFIADDGSFSKSFPRLQRHVIGLTLNGSKAEIDAVPSSWAYAVIFADLGTSADAFLVYRSERNRFSIRSVLDCTAQYLLEERV